MVSSATGMVSETEFDASEILIEASYAIMIAEPLIDDSGDIVMPVRNRQTPYFRRIGRARAPTDAPRGEQSPRHDAWVQSLLSDLEAAENRVVFYTNYFDGEKKQEKTLLAFGKNSARRWFSEQSILFPDRIRIMPDISGRSIAHFSPTGKDPAALIEVIHTNPPKAETFNRLVDLSMCSPMVFFYILGDHGEPRNQYYSASKELSDGSLRIRITHALIGGDLVINGDVQLFEGIPNADLSSAMRMRLKTKTGK